MGHFIDKIIFYQEMDELGKYLESRGLTRGEARQLLFDKIQQSAFHDATEASHDVAKNKKQHREGK